jgi:ABC-type amino acid transport substrate-binding protein
MASLVLAAGASAAKSPSLERVKKNGFLRCGVNEGLPGFANPDSKGNWSGFDVDFCRALAAVILNDPSKVRFTPTSAKVRFTTLQSGEVDLLSRNTNAAHARLLITVFLKSMARPLHWPPMTPCNLAVPLNASSHRLSKLISALAL